MKDARNGGDAGEDASADGVNARERDASAINKEGVSAERGGKRKDARIYISNADKRSAGAPIWQ